MTDRLACVDLPALPLQLLLLRRPQWRAFPVVIVDRDDPNGRVLWANQQAWGQQIRPGMRYAAALSLDGTLRAAVMSPAEVQSGIDELVICLRAFSPAVEPSAEEAGVFWLDAGGLGRLYASLDKWSSDVRDALMANGFRATIVVGFDRFSVYALARARHRLRVFPSREMERREVHKVPLDRLPLSADLREALRRLDLHSLGQLLALSESQVRQRLGEDAVVWHRRAGADAALPVRAVLPEGAVEVVRDLDWAERNTERLLFLLKSLLPGLVGELIADDAQVEAMILELHLDRDGGQYVERIAPAQPTLDEGLLLDLLRLRIDAIPLPTGVVRLRLQLVPRRAERRQGLLLEERPRRDRDAAARALARLRAEWGEDAVGVLCIGDGHLPEVRNRWRPVTTIPLPNPTQTLVRVLVRRVLSPPTPLPPRPRHEPDGWLVHGPESGPVIRCVGPHILSGGWWGTTIHREYHYLETSRGHLLWTFYDRRRRRWFLHGAIE